MGTSNCFSGPFVFVFMNDKINNADEFKTYNLGFKTISSCCSKTQNYNNGDRMKVSSDIQFLDLKQLSTVTTIPVPTLREYIKIGLPHYKINRKIRVKPKEFDEWMQQLRNRTIDNHNNFIDFLNGTLSK